MQTLFDASAAFTYFPDCMDTRRSLWFVRDALDVDEYRENTFALAAGADLSVFRECEPFLSAFPSVFVALADLELAKTIADALGEYAPAVIVLLPREGAFGDHANLREVLASGGAKAVSRLMMGAVEQDARGLLDLADIERVSMETMPSVLSGISELDRAISGFYPAELSVWTGKRGGGKSTLLGQALLEAVDQGQHVCAYSGELSAWRFKQWLSTQAAGPQNVQRVTDKFSGKEFFTVSPIVQKQIDEWMRGRFFLYDNRMSAASDEDSILSVFEYAVRRYGCSVFLVDNLMTARFSTSADRDFYRAQSNFTGRLVEFAKKNEVHVHLVAHPRKSQGRLDADDISGSGEITNRADNVFSLQRLTDEEAVAQGFQAVLRVLKNRTFGASLSLGLDFEASSKRFYKAGTGDPYKKYGWELCGPQEIVELPSGMETPFDERRAI